VTGGNFGFDAAGGVGAGVVVAGDCGVVVEGGDVVEGVDVAGAGGALGGGVSCAPATPYAESHDANRTVVLSRCERRLLSRALSAKT
jgi:hypothetical protein